MGAINVDPGATRSSHVDMQTATMVVDFTSPNEEWHVDASSLDLVNPVRRISDGLTPMFTSGEATAYSDNSVHQIFVERYREREEVGNKIVYKNATLSSLDWEWGAATFEKSVEDDESILDVSIAAKEEVVYIAWVELDATLRSKLYVVKSDTFGETFGKPELVSSTGRLEFEDLHGLLTLHRGKYILLDRPVVPAHTLYLWAELLEQGLIDEDGVVQERFEEIGSPSELSFNALDKDFYSVVYGILERAYTKNIRMPKMALDEEKSFI